MRTFTKEQLLKLINEYNKTIRTLEKDAYVTPTEYVEGYMNRAKLDRVKITMIGIIFKDLKTPSQVVEFFTSQNIPQNEIDNIFMKVINNNKNVDKDFETNVLPQIKTHVKNTADQVKAINEFFDANPQVKEKYSNALISGYQSMYKNQIDISTEEKASKFIDLVEKKEKLANIDLTNELKDNIQLSFEAEDRPYDKAIDNILKENELSQEDTKLISDAKNILSFGNGKATDFVNPFAEGFGDNVNRDQMLADMEYIQRNYKNYEKVDFGRQTYSLENFTPEEQIEASKRAFGDDNTINPKLQDDVYEVINTMLTIDPEGNMKPLKQARANLGLAIESGNIDKIKNSINKYNELDSKYQRMFDIFASNGAIDRFAINMSMARQAEIPGKYRNNIRGGTLFRLAGKVMQITRKYNLDLKEYIKDPIGQTRQVYSKLVKNNVISKFINSHSLTDVFDLVNGEANHEVYADNIEELTDVINASNALGLFTSMMPKGENAKFSADSSIIFETIGSSSGIEMQRYFSNNKTVKFARMLTVEKTDLNLNALDPDRRINPDTLELYPEFSLEEYVKSGKTTPERIIDRLLKVGETKANEEWFKDASNLVINELANIKDYNLDPQTKFVLNKMVKGGVNSVDKTDIAIMNGKYLSTAPNYINEACSSLYKLKQEYASRSIFWKIFGNDTARLRRSINEIEKNLTDRITKPELDRYMDKLKHGEIQPSDFDISIDELVSQSKEKVSSKDYSELDHQAFMKEEEATKEQREKQDAIDRQERVEEAIKTHEEKMPIYLKRKQIADMLKEGKPNIKDQEILEFQRMIGDDINTINDMDKLFDLGVSRVTLKNLFIKTAPQVPEKDVEKAIKELGNDIDVIKEQIDELYEKGDEIKAKVNEEMPAKEDTVEAIVIDDSEFEVVDNYDKVSNFKEEDLTRDIEDITKPKTEMKDLSTKHIEIDEKDLNELDDLNLQIEIDGKVQEVKSTQEIEMGGLGKN